MFFFCHFIFKKPHKICKNQILNLTLQRKRERKNREERKPIQTSNIVDLFIFLLKISSFEPNFLGYF